MKKLNLLLATTAMLSMGTMAVKATGTAVSDATRIDIDVKFVQSLTLTQANHLEFGTILNPEVGQEVAFSPHASCTHMNTRATEDNPATLLPGTQISKGKLTISGIDGYPVSGGHFEAVITDSSVTLRRSADSAECGIVNNFDVPYDADLWNLLVTDGEVCYYGDFTVTNVPAGNSSCTGQNTITVMYVPD